MTMLQGGRAGSERSASIMRPALRAKGGMSKDQLGNHRITTQDIHGAPLLVGRRHPTATSVRLAALSHRANASSPPASALRLASAGDSHQERLDVCLAGLNTHDRTIANEAERIPMCRGRGSASALMPWFATQPLGMMGRSNASSKF